MSATYDDRQSDTDYSGPWSGIFATAPNDFDDLVFVVLPSFDAVHRWGPMRWQSRDATSLPERGDKCLVMFDENREMWVVAWWPFVN